MTDPAGADESSLVALLADGRLDAELAGLLWLLVEGGVSVVVVGIGADAGALEARSRVVDALRACAATPRRTVGSDPAEALVEAAGVCLLAGELTAGSGDLTAGGRTRAVVRALHAGAGLLATAEAGRLEDLLDRLRRAPVGLTDDELSYLGIVLVLDADGRVAAAHYVRPLSRDVHGHLQRLPPAVLATRDEQTGVWAHFAWGVAAELASRLGRRMGDLEADRERRASHLADLLGAGVTAGAAVAGAIEGYRLAAGSPHRH
jgi:hypothetical protein